MYLLIHYRFNFFIFNHGFNPLKYIKYISINKTYSIFIFIIIPYIMSSIVRRLPLQERESKLRYLIDEYNLGRNPLPHITGLHPVDKIILQQMLNQYIRALTRSAQHTGQQYIPPHNQGYAGYKKTFRKKMKKGKSLRKPTKKHKKTYKKK